MGVWDILRLRRRKGVNERRDLAIEKVADEICRSLRGLGLYVESKAYRNGFCEIIASTSRKMITVPDGKEASGIALLLATQYDPPAVVFEEINSLRPGLGGQMVRAVIAGLEAHPRVFERLRVNDLSPRLKDGRRWWEHIASAYPEFDWNITHDEDVTHLMASSDVRSPARDRSECSKGPAASGDDIAKRPDFLEKRRRLEALAKEFGCEPGMVTLSPKKRIFEYLGQSFTAEGEAWPDGRIEIYFDPNMGDARMGCCLAHELQHLKYFEVRAAYHAERDDGPLHRRFASFTPELLAAQRGVSDYSNEHWDAWKGNSAPKLFSMELEEGQAEPINETIAEVAKAQYNWGPDVWINPVWKELQKAINEEYEKLRM